jgi:hypothetical protein
MNPFLLSLSVLRLIHIVAGALWVGAAVAYFLFFGPAAKGLGLAGPKFMQELVGKHRYPLFMNGASMLAILSGLGLFWFASGGLNRVWFTTGPGLGFTIGSLAGLAAFSVGFFGIRPHAQRLGALGAAIAAAGVPPTPEQGAELGRLDAEIHFYEQWDVLLLVVSLVTMATARYWIF